MNHLYGDFYQRTKMSQKCADTFASSTHIPPFYQLYFLYPSSSSFIQFTRELFSNRKSFFPPRQRTNFQFQSNFLCLKCFLTFQLTRQYFPSFSQKDIPNIPFDVFFLFFCSSHTIVVGDRVKSSEAKCKNDKINFRFHFHSSLLVHLTEINQRNDEIKMNQISKVILHSHHH
jgi:hypothetical protein